MNRISTKLYFKPVRLVFIIAFVLILSSFSTLATYTKNPSEEKISLRYIFETPTIKTIHKDGEIYHQITMRDASNSGKTGDPLLPSLGTKILLPQGTKVKNIEITLGEKVILGLGFNVEKCGEIRQITQREYMSTDLKDNDIYFVDEIETEESTTFSSYEEIGTYSFRGYQFLVMKLNPVEYNHETGELSYYNDFTITVETEKDIHDNLMFRGLSKDKSQIIEKVDNPKMADTYTIKNLQPLSSQEYDLLIITTDELKNDFERLADYHNENGVRTEIKTLITDIPVSYDIRQTCIYIRDYIRDAYTESGIEYVLIGGDYDIVPAQYLYARGGGGLVTTSMPTDMYYVCLDGDYNGDGDDFLGELEDDPDLIAELYIGRASVGNSDEIDNFIDKTITYFETTDPYLNKALMVGEALHPDYGGDHMDELINGCSNHGYTTVGISSIEYNMDKLYDRDWEGYDWPKSEFFDRINYGVHIINHLGHGYWDNMLKIHIDEYGLFTNEKNFFLYSQACYSGAFNIGEEWGDCIGEYLTIKNNFGAFAAILNAKFGWGILHSTNGPSNHYHREFWDAVFGENIPTISRANQDSKEDNLFRINEDCMLWCYYELNFFGDPTVAFQNLIEIGNVSGGTDISFEIINLGDLAINNVSWSIFVNGGVLGLINISNNEILETIHANNIETIKISDRIFGLGKISIEIQINKIGTESTEEKLNMFVIGPFILDVKG